MKTLRVGMRVRILWSKGWPELAGQTGVIVGRSSDGGVYGGSEWCVAPDCWGACEAPQSCRYVGDVFAPNSAQLEPLSDSNTIVSWSDCAWRPEGVEA